MPIEVFKIGTHTAEDGTKYSFPANVVQQFVSNYQRAVFAAPLVVGHPKTEDPAYGEVQAMTLRDDGVVEIEPADVEPQFAAMVNDKRFPKTSISLFPPSHSANPKPGEWYLRHVGFLGAAAPAIPGLRPAEFSGEDASVVTIEFSADTDARWNLMRLTRHLRDWLLARYGQEEADKVIPEWIAESTARASIEADSEQQPDDETLTGFAAQPTPQPTITTALEETTVFKETETDAQQAANFAAREADLAAREKKIADDEAARRAAEIASFAADLTKQGKILPREEAVVVALLEKMESKEPNVAFAAADGTSKTITPESALREFLSGLEARVDFSEHSAHQDDDVHATNFAAPTGYTVDNARLALHNKITAYAQQHNVDYATAAAAVGH